jgi:D-glycero-D-manno-heptose 1,7-bisphosphate phosphatase
VDYLARAEDMRLLPGVAAALRRLNAAGLPVVVITNQSGVARGLIDPAFAERGEELLGALLAAEGARIDGYYHCPHHPEGHPPFRLACDCRKPGTAMLERAAGALGLKLGGAYMVGDKRSDVETGAGLGVIPVLVRTGYGCDWERQLPAGFAERGGRIFDDFPAAVDWILSRRPPSPGVDHGAK